MGGCCLAGPWSSPYHLPSRNHSSSLRCMPRWGVCTTARTIWFYLRQPINHLLSTRCIKKLLRIAKGYAALRSLHDHPYNVHIFGLLHTSLRQRSELLLARRCHGNLLPRDATVILPRAVVLQYRLLSRRYPSIQSRTTPWRWGSSRSSRL